MIQSVTMYTVICDNCLADSGHGSVFACWESGDTAVQMAEESLLQKMLYV